MNKMISYEQALETVIKNARQLGSERILVEKSVGRILNEEVYSKIAMPPFDKSAMDGYAVRACDVRSVPAKLKCIGVIQAGQNFKKKLKRKECVKIMTGAPVPQGADSVVMVEDTRDYAGFIEVLKAARKKDNICFKGEDLKSGQRVLKKGERIFASGVAILATVGKPFVKVIRKPKVCLINTGGEIVPLGHKLSGNKIYNSNGPLLCAFLESDGIRPQSLGIAKDKAPELKEKIRRGLKTDVLLISGGVSMGDYDLVPSVLKELGVKEVFHKVNVKPGKPLFFGIKNKTLVFGTPGNPVSNFLSYLLYIRPAIYKMAGYSAEACTRQSDMAGYKNSSPLWQEGILDSEFYSKQGRKHFVLVNISKRRNEYYLSPVGSHGSADTMSLSMADGFMVVDENTGRIKKNSKARFLTWKTI